MRALGRPVLGYTNVVADYRRRVEAYRRASVPVADADAPDVAIEDFDLAENLMIEVAILASGGEVIRRGVPPGPRDARSRRVRSLPDPGPAHPARVAACRVRATAPATLEIVLVGLMSRRMGASHEHGYQSPDDYDAITSARAAEPAGDMRSSRKLEGAALKWTRANAPRTPRNPASPGARGACGRTRRCPRGRRARWCCLRWWRSRSPTGRRPDRRGHGLRPYR